MFNTCNRIPARCTNMQCREACGHARTNKHMREQTQTHTHTHRYVYTLPIQPWALATPATRRPPPPARSLASPLAWSARLMPCGGWSMECSMELQAQAWVQPGKGQAPLPCSYLNHGLGAAGVDAHRVRHPRCAHIARPCTCPARAPPPLPSPPLLPRQGSQGAARHGAAAR